MYQIVASSTASEWRENIWQRVFLGGKAEFFGKFLLLPASEYAPIVYSRRKKISAASALSARKCVPKARILAFKIRHCAESAAASEEERKKVMTPGNQVLAKHTLKQVCKFYYIFWHV